jgi:hypothetical protein
MSRALERYLDRVIAFSGLSGDETSDIREEQKEHLLTKIEAYEGEGLPREDAVFQAIEDHGNPILVGYGLRKGFPLLDVRLRGTARGIIAIGPKAVGVVALGGAAFGVIAIGGLGVGLFSFSGFALSLLFAWGGFAFAPVGVAYGGFAAGPIAAGGFAIGVTSWGAYAVGLWAYGGTVFSAFDPSTIPPALKAIGNGVFGDMARSVLHIVVLPIAIALIFAMIILQRKEARGIKSIDPGFVE